MNRRTFSFLALGALAGAGFAQSDAVRETDAARSNRIKGFLEEHCKRTGQCVLLEGNPMDAYYTDSPAAFGSIESFAKTFRYSITSHKNTLVLKKTYEDALDFPCFTHKELHKALLAIHALVSKHYSDENLKAAFNTSHPALMARLLQGPVRLSEMNAAESQGIQRVLLSLLSDRYFEILAAEKAIHSFHKFHLSKATFSQISGYFASIPDAASSNYRALLIKSAIRPNGEERHEEAPKFVNIKPILIAGTLGSVIEALKKLAPKVKLSLPEDTAERPVFAAGLSNRPLGEVLQGMALLEDLRLKQTSERAQLSLPEQVTVDHVGDFRPAIYAALPMPLLRYWGYIKSTPAPALPGFTPPPVLTYREEEELTQCCHSVLSKLYQRLEKKESVPVASLSNREACAALLLLLPSRLLANLGNVGRPLFREAFPASDQAIFLKAVAAEPGALTVSVHAETPGIRDTLRIGFGWPALK